MKITAQSVIAGIAIVLGSVIGCAAVAGPEAGHPNLIAARDHIQQAIEKLHAAQAANHDDMGGHAAKAEELLHEAEHEVKMAAEAANRH